MFQVISKVLPISNYIFQYVSSEKPRRRPRWTFEAQKLPKARKSHHLPGAWRSLWHFCHLHIQNISKSTYFKRFQNRFDMFYIVFKTSEREDRQHTAESDAAWIPTACVTAWLTTHGLHKAWNLWISQATSTFITFRCLSLCFADCFPSGGQVAVKASNLKVHQKLCQTSY